MGRVSCFTLLICLLHSVSTFQIGYLLGIGTVLRCGSVGTLPLWEQQHRRAQSSHAGKRLALSFPEIQVFAVYIGL